MARILLDQNVPYPLIRHLPGHDAVHASMAGWSELSNGLLITAAEAEGFTILITADQNLEYQQNLANRSLSLIVLSTNNWRILRTNLLPIAEAVGAARAGSYRFVAFDRLAPIRFT